MGVAFAFMLSGDAVIFTAALALMLGLGLLEVAGLGGVDGDADFQAEAGGTLDWLGVGRVPLLVFLILLLACFGVIGLIGQQLALSFGGATVSPLIAVPAALALALPATASGARLLARILPRDETSAIGVDELVGRIGVIVTGVAERGSPARARVPDRHGHPHFVMAEPANPGQRFSEGAEIILVERDGPLFQAIAWDNPLLPTLER